MVEGDFRQRQREEVPVEGVLSIGHLPDGVAGIRIDQGQVPLAIRCVHGKEGRILVRHVFGVRPGLVDADPPSLEVADLDAGIHIGVGDVLNARVGVDQNAPAVPVVIAVVDVFLEGVSVRDLRGAFHRAELGPSQDVADLHSVARGDPGDGAVDGGREADSGLLLIRQAVVAFKVYLRYIF